MGKNIVTKVKSFNLKKKDIDGLIKKTALNELGKGLQNVEFSFSLVILTYDAHTPDFNKDEFGQFLRKNGAINLQSYTATTIFFITYNELIFWNDLINEKYNSKNRNNFNFTLNKDIAPLFYTIMGNLDKSINTSFIGAVYPEIYPE